MNTPTEFIAMALPVARKVKATYGVPIAVLIAQGALESGWGDHVVANAYFGIKGHGTTFQTTEVINGQTIHEAQSFRAYTSFEDAAMDYGCFLASNPRYHACFQYDDSPEEFVQTLAKNGYATAPDYADKLIALIRQHNLAQYDQESQ